MSLLCGCQVNTYGKKTERNSRRGLSMERYYESHERIRERVTGTFIFCIIMQERVQFAQFIRKIKIENDRNTKQSIKYITGVRETKFWWESFAPDRKCNRAVRKTCKRYGYERISIKKNRRYSRKKIYADRWVSEFFSVWGCGWFREGDSDRCLELFHKAGRLYWKFSDGTDRKNHRKIERTISHISHIVI